MTWTVSTGTDSPLGPDGDHTVGDSSGHYLKAAANGNGSLMAEAVAVSPRLGHAFTTCVVNFWYFVDSPDGSVIRVGACNQVSM
jgi:hypothetical protein